MAGYSGLRGYVDTEAPDYPDEGMNTVDDQAANILRSLRNRFQGPSGEVRPDVGQYSAPPKGPIVAPLGSPDALPDSLSV